jgi:uncharacterized protein YvpB
MSLARKVFVAVLLVSILAACQPASTSTEDPNGTSDLSSPDGAETLTPFAPGENTPQPPTATATDMPPSATPTPSKPIVCDPNAPDPPPSALVDGVIGYPQAYSLSCEARSAADLASFWGIDVLEGVFFSQLPKSDNPEVGFVGFVSGEWGKTPPLSYGVHAEPVAAVMRQYGLEALAHKGLDFRCLQLEIAAGRPVLVWIVGHAWQGAGVQYFALDGTETIVAPYEHTMILFGYDELNVYLVDAFTAAVETHPVDTFLFSWAALGNMALTVTDADPAVAENMQYSGSYYEVQYGDSLLGLAAAWGIPWDSLAALNGIVWPFDVYPGQILKTGQPLTAASFPTPTVTSAP